jgi:two-component system osmolarity sensor histidine kinase EnvZ
VLLVAFWFSWHISRPIISLVQATDRLAAGKPARVEPAGPSETRLLGERFNVMLDTLRESESTRRTLLAGLPHDLKAPLARMWLRVEMTDDLALKNGMRTDLQDMQKMVDQFIHFLRGTDIASYHFAPIALNDWVQERIGNWQGAADGSVELMGIPATVTVNADSVALSRLLDNLVSNALHHGTPPVHVTLAVQGSWAVLTVSDHGPGIAPELRDNALKPFVRLDEARTRTGNVGLGLALAEAIARAHAGSLTLGQGPEGGLQVQVLLPVYLSATQS